MQNEENEIRSILEQDGGLDFEEIPESGFSPLNEPVIEKDIADIGQKGDEGNGGEYFGEEGAEVPLDAPEQEINEGTYGQEQGHDGQEEAFELPNGHALQAADSLLGMADNLLGVGGGFFVKIRKEPGYYDFEELIQVIDEQNEKNVKRIKLDADDKELLRPILMAILKKKAKKLTPEQQLFGTAMTIIVKKFQVVMEVRNENLILESRIRAIVMEATGQTTEDEHEEPSETEETTESVLKPGEYDVDQVPLSSVVMEVADEDKKEE